MRPRKTKRTAGERRYRALVRKCEQAIYYLDTAQLSIENNEAKGLTQKPAYIMQRITEAKERLKS